MRIFRYFSKNLLFRPLNLHFRPWSRKQKFLRIKFYLGKQPEHSMIGLLEPSRVSQAIQNSVQIIIKVIFRLRESPYLWPGWNSDYPSMTIYFQNNMLLKVIYLHCPGPGQVVRSSMTASVPRVCPRFSFTLTQTLGR